MNWKSQKGQIMVKIAVAIESLKNGLSALISSYSPFKPQDRPCFLPHFLPRSPSLNPFPFPVME